MSTLRHPFIVPYIDSWVQDGHTVNLIIGHCEKGDLGSAVAARRQHTKFWPEEQLALWLAQLLLALHHLQAKSILHRDLKSGNIFLTAAGIVF